MRPLIATWLFLSRIGKSPISTQQFAAIGPLTNCEVGIRKRKQWMLQLLEYLASRSAAEIRINHHTTARSDI